LSFVGAGVGFSGSAVTVAVAVVVTVTVGAGAGAGTAGVVASAPPPAAAEPMRIPMRPVATGSTHRWRQIGVFGFDGLEGAVMRILLDRG
jgi:hypothetical protein